MNFQNKVTFKKVRSRFEPFLPAMHEVRTAQTLTTIKFSRSLYSEAVSIAQAFNFRLQGKYTCSACWWDAIYALSRIYEDNVSDASWSTKNKGQ